MKKRLLVFLALGLIVGYFGVNYTKDFLQARAYAESDRIAAEVDPGIVASNTRFAFDVFNALCEEDPDANVFISPLSLSAALTMTYSGAAGNTEEAMMNTLGYSEMNTEQVEDGFKNLLSSLENVDREVTLSIANSVWMRDSFEASVFEDYKETLSDCYDSEFFARPFNQGTVNELNEWVAENTEHKIEKIIDSIEPDHVMFLVNAIYFKADWTHQFKESNTQERDFYLSDGTVVSVDTMSQGDDFRYYRGGNFAAARFPYGREQVAMYMFLPDPGDSLDQFIAGLSHEALDEYINEMRVEKGLKVRLPRFRFEYGVKRMNDALIKLGMGVAFELYNADFSKIADVRPENLYIDFVDHKAVIEVDEKGTEAAAATNVGISVSSAPPPPKQFYVNRPFFFVIRDDRTGTILFMGKITNPLLESGP
jgi:serine protease inhibitor